MDAIASFGIHVNTTIIIKEIIMAQELLDTTENTKSKYFLNLYITLSNGKRVKVAMTTLDWNLEKGSTGAKAFTKALIEKHKEKGEAVNIKGLTATFVIANNNDGEGEEMDFSSMFE